MSIHKNACRTIALKLKAEKEHQLHQAPLYDFVEYRRFMRAYYHWLKKHT